MHKTRSLFENELSGSGTRYLFKQTAMAWTTTHHHRAESLILLSKAWHCEISKFVSSLVTLRWTRPRQRPSRWIRSPSYRLRDFHQFFIERNNRTWNVWPSTTSYLDEVEMRKCSISSTLILKSVHGNIAPGDADVLSVVMIDMSRLPVK